MIQTTKIKNKLTIIKLIYVKIIFFFIYLLKFLYLYHYNKSEKVSIKQTVRNGQIL